MPASGFRSQITLRNQTASRLLQSLWELFQQKLSLNFTAARCCPVLLHKIKMLNAIGLAVEFSRITATRP
jgi:hypothetical protein